MRIVALLLGLAALAERACRAPFPIQVLVMGFLRRAEPVAWNFIAGEIALPEPVSEGDDPESAIRLAERFRALAVALAAWADRFSGCGRVHIGIPPAPIEVAGHFADAAREKLQPFDTS